MRYLSVIVVAFASFVLVGCEASPTVMKPPVESQDTPYVLDFSEVQIVGNGAYIPIQRGWNTQAAGSNDVASFVGPKDVLVIIDGFQKAHPEFEVLNWTVDRSGNYGDFISGIWVVIRRK